MTREALPVLAIEIECFRMPDAADPRFAGLRLDVQQGKEVVQDIICDRQNAAFSLSTQVEIGENTLDFRGPFVHGPRGGRFIYLCWGERREGVWVGSRRAKISLAVIPRELVKAAVQTNTPLRASICASNDKGEPVAAALKSGFVVWSVQGRN